MAVALCPQPLDLELAPEEVVARWPEGRRLVAWGLGDASPHARWALIAEPSAELTQWPERRFATHADRPPSADPDAPPFCGGWIGCLEYALGASFEPAASLRPSLGTGPVTLHRVDAALCFDKLRRRWWRIGEPPSLGGAHAPGLAVRPASNARSHSGRGGYIAAVERAIEYIRAGDVYQVNLSHRLEAEFDGSPRAAFVAMLAAARPWYGAYIEGSASGGDGRTILSASPELFFEFDAATRGIVTRPMKGTRPADAGAELERSEKERAELAMIVDLMRNDLGRICEFGSVRVDGAREIEPHERVLQAVSTVRGRVREGLEVGAILRAVFPGGSITGAPKIRAMQIIEELEPVARGPYCGAIGYISDCGSASFSMAIRTAVLQAGRILYHVGAGIIADSVPEREWAETLLKAGPFFRTFGLDPESLR
jgi:para-aminobenzoate synthetase component 1